MRRCTDKKHDFLCKFWKDCMEYQRLLRTEKVASIAENFSEYGILRTAYIKYFVLQKDML